MCSLLDYVGGKVSVSDFDLAISVAQIGRTAAMHAILRAFSPMFSAMPLY